MRKMNMPRTLLKILMALAVLWIVFLVFVQITANIEISARARKQNDYWYAQALCRLVEKNLQSADGSSGLPTESDTFQIVEAADFPALTAQFEINAPFVVAVKDKHCFAFSKADDHVYSIHSRILAEEQPQLQTITYDPTNGIFSSGAALAIHALSDPEEESEKTAP